MTSDTPIAIVSRFETAARQDFEHRVREASRVMLRLMTVVTPGGTDVRAVTRELVGMTEDERYVLLRHVIHDSFKGPDSLEGMESLSSFVCNALLDDGPCTVVPEPEPADLDQDVRFLTTLDFVRYDDDNDGLSEDALRAKALDVYRRRERPLVLVRAGDEDAVAGPDEILAAIAHNRDMERRRQAHFDAFLSEVEEPSGPRPG